jgi:Cof subfamily protein (haloacid dehalogenase superfamily)
MTSQASRRSIDGEAVRAVAIDLDGTTLHGDSTMSQRTIEVLRACVEKGIAVLLCTGRSPVSAERFRAAIGATGPMVFYNGAVVIDAGKGTVLASTLMDAEICAYCVELARKQDVHFHGFLPGDRLVYDRRRPETDKYEKRTGLVGEVVDLASLFVPGGAGTSGLIKGMFIADGAILDRIQASLDDRFGSRIYRAKSDPTFLEVMTAGVSKGAALRVALSLRGIQKEATIAFGDAENDIPLLEAAGFGVAVANAHAAVRKTADAVAPSNEEDGVASFLEKLCLHR